MIYLASPFSDADGNVRQQRFEAACRVAANMMRAGHTVFSPVAHSYPLAQHGNLPDDWAYWQRADAEFLWCCDSVVVLALPDWHTSRGVRAEIAIAAELQKPISIAWDMPWVDPVQAREDAERLAAMIAPAEETPGLCRA